jgi:hypothetical protein
MIMITTDMAIRSAQNNPNTLAFTRKGSESRKQSNSRGIGKSLPGYAQIVS